LLEQKVGKGAGYPVIFDPLTGGVRVAESVEKANQDLHVILVTPLGSILGMPDFGSKLYLLWFEPIDDVFFDRAETYIVEALGRWAPWCIIRKFQFDHYRQNHVKITMFYTVENSSVERSFEFDFFTGAGGE